MARPGIIRYPDEPIALPNNPLLPNPNWGLVERVTMRQGDESAGLMPSDLTRLDYYNEWRANQRWIEEFKEK